ncbi:MAG: BMP family protein [Fimbriimonadaceae bacterium]|nr:MAG: BMP family protein [Fimbriimonadaceae bacterium]
MSRWIIALFAILLVIVGCSGGDKGTAVSVKDLPVGKPVEGKLKVALLTPGNVNDSGWSALANRGLLAIEKDLGAEVSQQTTKDAAIKDAMRSFAQDGYQLVIGHGFEYNGPAAEIAKEFPNTVFVSSSGGETTANSGAFRFYLEQGFYLAGFIAGKQSKTGKVGMIGGPDVPSIRSTFKAFAAGAKAANPSIEVIEKFTGSNDDVAKAKQATLQAIAEGADYLIHQTNAAVTGFFSACEEKNVWAFGANEDQNKLSPQCIASAVILAEKPFVALATLVKEGKYHGEIQLVGMQEGAVDFVLNPLLASEIQSEVREEITKLQAAIIAGELTIPKDEF